MNATEKHIIETACTKLVNQYYTYSDLHDFEAVCSLLTGDASFARPTEPDNVITGRDNILAAFNSRPKDRITRHIVSNVVIDVIDGSNAKGRFYVTLFMAPIDAEPAKFGVKANPSQLVGDFQVDFALAEEGWRISLTTGKVVLST